MNSSKLKGYLTGLILGDGSIDKGTNKRAFRIKSINLDFIEKIKNDLEQVTNWDIYIKHHEESNIKGVHRKPLDELTVKAQPYFVKMYHYFYDDYKRRIISRKMLNYLNPEGLANWYMSDGYITHVGKTKGVIKDRRVDICTDRYSEKDVDKIILYFKEEYGWNLSKIRRKQNNKVVYRIRFPKKDAQELFIMIYPHVTKSFLYKLDMKYEHRPDWMLDEYYNIMLRCANTLTYTDEG